MYSSNKGNVTIMLLCYILFLRLTWVRYLSSRLDFRSLVLLLFLSRENATTFNSSCKTLWSRVSSLLVLFWYFRYFRYKYCKCGNIRDVYFYYYFLRMDCAQREFINPREVSSVTCWRIRKPSVANS